MYSPKISIITVCYNAEQTIRRCIQSVIAQDYGFLEYIVIDGNSKDNTLLIINEYQSYISKFISEPDKGLYDAMNKGIATATGDVVGILNADDFFVNNTIISSYAEAFGQSGADVVYGDLNFVNSSGAVVRRWKSGQYKKGIFNRGWMPPHPAFYAKKSLFDQLGNYRLDYGSAADYELMLRFMHRHDLKVYYIQITVLHMQTGGVSNKNITSRVKAYTYDFKAMQNNGIRFPFVALLLKPLRKVFQYFV